MAARSPLCRLEEIVRFRPYDLRLINNDRFHARLTDASQTELVGYGTDSCAVSVGLL